MEEYDTGPDFTGVITAALLLPVALTVYHFRNADAAVTTFLSLGMIVLAAKIKWPLREHLWFWFVLLIAAALHVPLIIWISLPTHWVHGIVLLPVCTADLLLVLGMIRLTEKILLPAG